MCSHSVESGRGRPELPKHRRLEQLRSSPYHVGRDEPSQG